MAGDTLNLIFVYGTLRAGEVNHGLLKGCRFLGCCRTAPLFTMFDMGGYPAVVAGGTTSITGEVYRIDGKTLERLDTLEEYPHLYDRVRMETPFGPAWFYLYVEKTGGRPLVPGGDWSERERPGKRSGRIDVTRRRREI